MTASTERFGDRVADYVRTRPGYPDALVTLLTRELGLSPATTRVVDVGSGTGLSALPFLRAGFAVTGVEPNAGMRAAAEDLLRDEPRFTSVAGTAEQTTLPDTAADLLIAAQAFHWFDRAAARAEARRVLAPGGHAALVWNDRRLVGDAFHEGYEAALLRWGTDYQAVRHDQVGEAALAAFFGDAPRSAVLDNHQDLDREGLVGRALSSSYVPKAGQPGHEPLMNELDRLFSAHAREGRVRIVYDTRVWFGPLTAR
ncbi:MAG: class I SAM-dependent methyltransferase [Myxococcales bacterium]|nr:class I SAM-dependent methyltransferase [Myxococcales bacterium]